MSELTFGNQLLRDKKGCIKSSNNLNLSHSEFISESDFQCSKIRKPRLTSERAWSSG